MVSLQTIEGERMTKNYKSVSEYIHREAKEMKNRVEEIKSTLTVLSRHLEQCTEEEHYLKDEIENITVDQKNFKARVKKVSEKLDLFKKMLASFNS